MANYPAVAPYSLANLDATTPLDTEDASKIAEIDRQTRAIIKEVILKEHAADGTHIDLPTATLADKAVTGAKIANDAATDSLRAISVDHIKNDAVITRSILDASVTAAKLAADAVTTVKLANLAVTGAKIDNATISAGKYVADSVRAADIRSSAGTDGDRSITRDHIRDSAINTAKLDNLAVSPAKMASLAANTLLVGTGTGVAEATVAGALALAYAAGVATFSLTGAAVAAQVAILSEQGTSGANGTASWNERPVNAANSTWNEIYDSANLLSVSGKDITIAGTGTYMIFAAGVMGATEHQLRIYNATTSTALLYGINTPGASVATCFGLVTIVTANTILRLQHWADSAVDSGNPNNSTATQVFAQFVLLKLA